MTPRQQLLAVYTGGQPDAVPALADLSYWHAGNGGGEFIPGTTDGADAVTPAPWGDLTPAECRVEAGPNYVLSGGIPPGSFNSSVPLRVFDGQVEAWLESR